MAFERAAVVLLVLIFASCASGSWITVSELDDWTTLQSNLGGDYDAFSSMNGDMLGGNRDMVYKIIGNGGSNVENVDGSRWATYAVDGNGSFSLQYDGPDETEVLITNGLGSVDFTANGGMAFYVNAFSYFNGSSFALTVYTNNGTRICNWTQELQQSTFNYFDYYREFHDMDGCDFTQVSAVEIIVPFPNASVSIFYFDIVTDPSIQQPSPSPMPTPSPVPTPSRSPASTPGGTQTLTIGYAVSVCLSPTESSTFVSEQIDPSTVSSISFVCQTPSTQVCMYTMYGSPPTQFSFDQAACSSASDPIELTYSTVKSGVYYAVLIAGEPAMATVLLAAQP